ncbi:MAG: DUF11 domain-containing protein, partial [Chloroflexi bacterium]|nr:DUF11 domain-containing protein [Chloroflexota bacterium]
MHQTAQVNGQIITYTLTYTNIGPDLVIGATITDTLNSTLSNVTVNSSGTVITGCRDQPGLAGGPVVRRAEWWRDSGRGTFAVRYWECGGDRVANQDLCPKKQPGLCSRPSGQHLHPPGHNSFPSPRPHPLAITFSRDVLPATVTQPNSHRSRRTDRALRGTFTVN